MIKKSKPRILFFDIETMANQAYVWGKYEQDVITYKQHWYMISFAWKWLDEKQTHVLSLPDFKTYKKDPTNDVELITALWKLFNEADVVVAHNGLSFDVKKSNARFMKHHLKPPSPYKIIDTKLVAKKYFKMDSNKLDDIGDYFGLGRKINTGGFELWLGCERGDKKSWDKMCRYNKQDVILLEKVYLAMLPYMTNHPNIGVLVGEKRVCPNCGSSNVHKRGFTCSRTTRYQSYQCQNCGSWHQSPLKDNSQIR